MKAEINLENKAKFFRQYFGQEVWCNEFTKTEPLYEFAFHPLYLTENAYVELKEGNGSVKDGYLVPFKGLTCEELIEAGWAKYKE